ncbi:hypothetical protein BDR22DRAFT_199014 [Usnea florida]
MEGLTDLSSYLILDNHIICHCQPPKLGDFDASRRECRYDTRSPFLLIRPMSSMTANMKSITTATTVFSGSETHYHGSPRFDNSDRCTASHNASRPSRGIHIIKSCFSRRLSYVKRDRESSTNQDMYRKGLDRWWLRVLWARLYADFHLNIL